MEVQKFKNALVEEIFIAYREAGFVHQKAGDDEVKGQMEIVRFGLERMLNHMLPLSEQHEKILRELRVPFIPI